MEFDLGISSFNTTIAQVVHQLPATGVQIEPLDTFLQPVFIVRNIASNTAGTIRYAATQVDPSSACHWLWPRGAYHISGIAGWYLHHDLGRDRSLQH